MTLPAMQLNGFDLRRRVVLMRNSPTGFLPAVDGYLSLTAFWSSPIQLRFGKENVFSWE